MYKLSRSSIEEQINLKAWKDPNFKAKLIAKPNEALKEVGLDVPSHAKIYVHEETPNTWHLTIRHAPPNAQNLSEEELKKVSGGQKGGECMLGHQ